MNRNLSALREHLRRMPAAYLVLVLALVLTWLAYRRAGESAAARDQARFDQAAQALRDTLFQRIESVLSALRGVRALFDAGSGVGPDPWQQYTRSIDLKGNYRGLLDIGYAPRVTRAGREAHVEAMRAAGWSAYNLSIEGDRAEAFPLVYLMPAKPSAPWTPGRDLFNEPQARTAMERARLADRPMATGKLPLRTPDGQGRDPGLVIYLPVYRGGVKPAAEDQRREATTGFVFASLVAEELGASILRGQSNLVVGMQVYDGNRPSRDNLLFGGGALAVGDEPGAAPRLRKSVTVEGLGRSWTMQFFTLPAFEAEAQGGWPRGVLAGGLVVSFLLFWAIWTEARARAAAEVLSGELRRSEDIQKRTNEELRARIRERQEAEEALAAEKERLTVTLRSIGDAVMTTDVRGRVVLWNKAAEELSGWRRAEAAGRPLEEVFQILDEDSRRPLDNPGAPFLKPGAGPSRGAPAILVNRHGSERIVLFSGAPIHDQSDQTIGAVLVFRDVTEHRKLEAELHKASKLESLGLLAGGIAHDFNNVLTGIFGNVSLARLLAPQDGPVLERLDKAEQACMRAREITGQLLTFARGGAPIKRALSVPELLKDACEMAVLGSNVRCETELGPGLRPVDGDGGQIAQVLNHLLLNAVQAMPGGGTILVQAENVPPGGRPGLPLASSEYVRISIRDQGPGIAPEHLHRLFDPFFTTKHKGRGLGLATSYSIVRKNDGVIEVDSKPGHGAAFHVYLPASLEPCPAEREAVEPLPTGQGRVLVMDDEPEILNFSHAALKRLGYEAELARDGAEAIRRYCEARDSGRAFAAVIMDLTIPGGMGGQEAVRQLLEVDPGARAIVSSGYSNDPVMADFAKYGFRAFVAKPYEIHQLARVLHEVTRPGE